MNEALITINGVRLDVGQSMTLRVALASFLATMQEDGLGEDSAGKAMAEAYIARATEIEQLLFQPFRVEDKQCAASGQADCCRTAAPGSEYCAQHSNRKINWSSDQ